MAEINERVCAACTLGAPDALCTCDYDEEAMPNNTGPMDEQVERVTPEMIEAGRNAMVSDEWSSMIDLNRLPQAYLAMHSASVIDEGLLDELLAKIRRYAHDPKLSRFVRETFDDAYAALANQRSGSNG